MSVIKFAEIFVVVVLLTAFWCAQAIFVRGFVLVFLGDFGGNNSALPDVCSRESPLRFKSELLFLFSFKAYQRLLTLI